MKRRSFLGAILAAGAAPMIVKAGVLMPVRPLTPSWAYVGCWEDRPAWMFARVEGEYQRVMQMTDGPSSMRRTSFEWNGEVWVPTRSLTFNL